MPRNKLNYRILKIYAVWGEVKVFTLVDYFLLLISSEGDWKFGCEINLLINKEKCICELIKEYFSESYRVYSGVTFEEI
ncbi:MAG: hypothetical protein ACOYVK_10545 [Bacillota bacterium]